MRATMSLLGLYNYDNTILDGLILPSNFEVGASDQLKNNLLMETAEFEILYPEPSFLKYAIGQWAKKHFTEWEELRKTQLYEYNPIWNADYKISDRTDTDRDLRGTNDTQQDYTRNLAEAEATARHVDQLQTDNRQIQDTNSGDITTEIKNHITEKSGDDTTTNSVYSYNDTSTGVPRDKSKTDYGSKDTENGKTIETNERELLQEHTGTTDVDMDETINRSLNQTGTTRTNTDNDTTEAESTNVKYERWLRGNYGVKTTQAMIEEQRNLVKFNLFDYIINQFKERFCIAVY